MFIDRRNDINEGCVKAKTTQSLLILYLYCYSDLSVHVYAGWNSWVEWEKSFKLPVLLIAVSSLLCSRGLLPGFNSLSLSGGMSTNILATLMIVSCGCQWPPKSSPKRSPPLVVKRIETIVKYAI